MAAPTDKESIDALKTALYGFNRKDKKDGKPHKFWNTQPVPQTEDDVKNATEDASGPIETKTLADVKKEGYKLPAGFKWVSCNVEDEKELDEIYTLLSQNYVEDDDNMFRFDYSREFLKWALLPPGFNKELHVGVRVEKSNKLVGFITGIPVNMRVYKEKVRMVEINFLCVHKKLRAKRLAPVLIKEVTRRVNLMDVWQAVYTAGVVLPKPIAKNRYFHRSLNPKKLISIGFSRLEPGTTMTRTIKRYSVAKSPHTPGMRPMEKKDVPQCQALISNYLSKFPLHQEYDEVETAHWFLPREGVVCSFVVEDPADKKITDFVSFYSLPSHIIGNKEYSTLNAAYSFYNVSTKTPWRDLMSDALCLAKQKGFDVFNALNVMENTEFLEHLKFGKGDGQLQYYLYNWRCPEMTPDKVGLVLL